MSEGIKKMLAEKAALRAKRTPPPIGDHLSPKGRGAVDSLFEIIDRAAPFMDEGCDPKLWKPSVKLKLLYFVASSSPFYTRRKMIEAYEAINHLLQKSRDLWTAGLHPDPFRAVESPWQEGQR